MDGKGSYRDNLFIERLWRTVKYEVYLKAYQNGVDAHMEISDYFRLNNGKSQKVTIFAKNDVNPKSKLFLQAS